MQSPSNGRSAGRPRELIALVAGSLACVLVLAAGIASGGVPPMALPGSQPMATGVLVAAGVPLAAASIWSTVVRAKREERRAVAEASGLKRTLAAADSIIRSEPQ